MGFAAMNTIEHPPWDSNTDEVAIAIGGTSTGTHVIPSYCYFVIISHDGTHNTGILVSPDAGNTTGILFADGAADATLPLHVTPGVTLQIHNLGASTGVNIVRFYNQPSN